MAGKPTAASSAAITPLCDAKPTPNLLVKDGAAVLLPATVERQKAMPSALCSPVSSRPRILPHAAAAANGPSAITRAGIGFGLVASPRVSAARRRQRTARAL